MTLHVESTSRERMLRIGFHAYGFFEEKCVSATIFIGMVLKIFLQAGLGWGMYASYRHKGKKRSKRKRKKNIESNFFCPAAHLMCL